MNSNESWIAPATIKDQASAKWALDLNKNIANIMQVFKITDKNEGKKNLPLIFKIELKIADSVTKIKKGKVIVNNWPAKINWFLLSVKPGAKTLMTSNLKIKINIERIDVNKRKIRKILQKNSTALCSFSFFCFMNIGIKTLLTAPSANILLKRLGNL